MPDLQLLSQHPSSHLKPCARLPPSGWNLKASPAVALARNPLRSLIASVTATPPETSQDIINLGLGDPTHYPLHPPPPAATTAVVEAVVSGRANGYVPGTGTLAARQAIADYHATWDDVEYDADSIVMTHGVGQAIDLIFSVLCPHARIETSNVLLPRPVFAQYPMMLSNLGVEVRYYDCIEANGWEADVDAMRDLVDADTKAIVVINPNNPCGSNYSRSHLLDILSIAEEWKVPVVADEIYGHMTWSPFHPMASLSKSAPILTLSGLSKRFLLPGWRCGWICLHDPLRVAGSIKEGLNIWGNRFFGPSSITQAALPAILATDERWHQGVTALIKRNADIVSEGISAIDGLSVVPPQGALYMLVRIGEFGFQDDVDFCAALYREQAVFVLPGVCFEAPGYFRVVLGCPEEVMRQVVQRLEAFCYRHRV